MKRTLFVLVVVVALTMSFGGVAYAVQGNSNYANPTPGQSPHGAYLDSTEKCRVCHAVHHPTGGGERLLRSTVTNACTYCHVSANFAIKTVYAEDAATNYSGADLSNAHSAAGGATCVGCHQVHAATNLVIPSSENAYAYSKLLRRPTGAGTYDVANSASVIADADSLQTGLTNKQATSAYCTQCHAYWNEAYDGDSHTMRAPAADYRGMGIAVATASSATCRDCHQGGVTDVDWDGSSDWVGKNAAGVNTTMTTAVGDLYQGANNWPHFVNGDRLLKDDVAVGDASKDQPCLDCHPNAGTTF